MHQIKVVATRKFNKEIKDYLDEGELSQLSSHLINYPESGDIIKNTGGLRKLRWKIPKSNKGKFADCLSQKQEGRFDFKGEE
ncbi:MAG: hypothetical protein OXU45_03525 [Candidatus Melainabacteria bacterium]|nr:hypothetical protein [Candidatus Melainabacteria bacterium]